MNPSRCRALLNTPRNPDVNPREATVFDAEG
jgi:hypothetical protein